MRLPRIRLRLRTQLALIALLAIALSYADQARRRWVYCWAQEKAWASYEQTHLKLASLPNPPNPEFRRVCIECANKGRRMRLAFRWAAFRFWEPPELAESETGN
jgi:hypothetical protein